MPFELQAKDLRKKFRLSRKAQRERNTSDPYIKAVNGLSLTATRNEIYGLLGPNGAGKTTTLRMLSSLIKPDLGEIHFEGNDIYKDIYSYRKKVGFLTSELKMDDFFSPSYTFTYMGRLYGIEDGAIEERKKILFDKFGISKFAHNKIANLSTGMKQKASLAISLCHDPDIIIFDEPTNGLDLVASKTVEDFLLELKKEGKIIIVSTHIFSLAEKLCDRIGIMIDGKIVAEGNKEELLKEQSLESLFFSLYGEERK